MIDEWTAFHNLVPVLPDKFVIALKPQKALYHPLHICSSIPLDL